MATITLNRPEKKNALSEEMTPALRSLLRELEKNEEVKSLVLTGAGSSFCSGGDVSTMKSLGKESLQPVDYDRVETLRMKQRTLTLRLFELSKPTIAAICGPAAGAGLSIALACDFRIMKKGTFITTGYSKIGLSGDYGGSWLMTHLTNMSITKDLYFSSRRVDSIECLELGLVNKVVAQEEFLSTVNAFAIEMANMAPLAVKYLKSTINSATSSTLSEHLDSEAENLFRCADSMDHKNAIKAFLEKRNPKFSGE